jgi:tRNA A-37 threonylcarbamoyl transferase component Bud32
MADTAPDPKTAVLPHEALEAAWLAWRPGTAAPRWHEFLPEPGQPVSPEAVFLLLQLDLEFRAKAGLPGLLQEQHLRHPRVNAGDAGLGAERLVELVQWEYQQRWKRGRRACRADYVAGLPELAVPPRGLRVRWDCSQCGRNGIVLEDDQAEQAHCPGCQAVHAVTDLFPVRPWCAAGDAEAAKLPRGDQEGILAGQRIIAGYEVLGEIGRGGMGVVYKARQPKLNRLVALKMVLVGSHASEQELGRFRAEAEAVARLQHPNVVQIYEVGEQNGLPYFSLEYCDGGSLAAQLNGTPLPAPQAARLVETLAGAVHAAHQQKVVHRDLKPANVLLTADGTPKITDFGLAKKLDGGTGPTASGAIVGTPSYMAPEQAGGKGKEVSPATDVYALGAILYELLTGRPPFRAATPLDTMLQVLGDEPVPVRRLQPQCSRDLETICLKCLEKEPSRRYDTAAALADDLARLLRGEPIQARPSGPADRVLKWAKRKPALACLMVVLVLWYFNLRPPWPWEWLGWVFIGVQWAFYDGPWGFPGVFVVWGLWRLGVVCGRAVGKFRSTPLHPYSDGILLPGMVLAVLVLCFYHGDLAGRKSLAGAIVLIVICWGLMFAWLVRRTRAGPLSVALRAPLPLVMLAGITCSGTIVVNTVELFAVSEQAGGVRRALHADELPGKPGPRAAEKPRRATFAGHHQHARDPLSYSCSRFISMSSVFLLSLLVSVGTEIRKKGCVTFFRSVGWEEIESYCWRQGKYRLSVRLNLHNSRLFLETSVHPAKKQIVDRILLAHVPPTEPELTVVDQRAPAQAVRDAAAELHTPTSQDLSALVLARTVRDPAALVLFSGIVQFLTLSVFVIALGGALIVNPRFEKALGMSKSTGLVVFCLAAVSAASGAVVVIGAWRMRKLKNYRFCRVACILATLPLGHGFLVGLPCGIWALRVLSRADVKAAFAANAS